MMNRNSEPLTEVLEKYPFTVKGIRTESYKDKKGVWWVETTEGMKILKSIPTRNPCSIFF
jgi:spore coat-associated protein S